MNRAAAGGATPRAAAMAELPPLETRCPPVDPCDEEAANEELRQRLCKELDHMEKEQPLRGTPHYRGHIGAPPGSERHPGLHPARSVRTAARVAARVPAARARVPPARARAARRPPAAQAGASRATSA